MGSPELLASKFVFLCVYIAIAIAILFVYQVMLQTSNDFIRQMKRYAAEPEHQKNVRSYTKKRNKLFTTNLFILLFLYILITNYGLNYDQVDYWLPAHIIMPILIIVLLINYVTCSNSLRSSFNKILTSLDDDFLQKRTTVEKSVLEVELFLFQSIRFKNFCKKTIWNWLGCESCTSKTNYIIVFECWLVLTGYDYLDLMIFVSKPGQKVALDHLILLRYRILK